MQKLLRRTALAEAQVARRARRKNLTAQRDKIKNKGDQDRVRSRYVSDDIKRERRARREDYELGPLAPRRDVGTMKDVYGTVNQMQMTGIKLSPKQRLEQYPDTPHYINIAVDDRVVILHGKDKGLIGKVATVNKETYEVSIEGLNMVDISVPEYMQKAEQTTQPVRSIPKGIPLSSVRLVFPYTNPTTGVKRDVIASRLLNDVISFDRRTGRARWSRYVPGADGSKISVPWPIKKPTKHVDHPNDTLRTSVELRTFVPTLLSPPMPSSVIDELRNKFSKFRTRHTEEYIQEKIQEEELAAERKASVAKMLEPLRTIKAMARLAINQDRKEKGWKTVRRPKVSTEMLGQAMARVKGLEEFSSSESSEVVKVTGDFDGPSDSPRTVNTEI